MWVRVAVRALPPELALPRDGLERLDGAPVGRPTRVVRAGLHRAPGHRVHARLQPEWEVPRHRRYVSIPILIAAAR